MKLLGWCGISIQYESDGLSVICRKAVTKHVDSFFQIHNIQWTKGKLLVILPNHQKSGSFSRSTHRPPALGHQGTVSKALQNTGPTIWLLPGDIQPQAIWRLLHFLCCLAGKHGKIFADWRVAFFLDNFLCFFGGFEQFCFNAERIWEMEMEKQHTYIYTYTTIFLHHHIPPYTHHGDTGLPQPHHQTLSMGLIPPTLSQTIKF